MPDHRKKKGVKKPNKFEKISPEPFIKLAEKNPNAASKKLRDRYEVSDYAHPHAIGGILKDERSSGWYKLAELLSESDPVLAKSIYMPLLRTRNFYSDKEVVEEFMPNMEVVAQQLHDLENKIPETNEHGRIAILTTLVNCASPDQVFWEDCLDRRFELASKLTKLGEEGYMGAIAETSFYAENLPVLLEKSLNETSQRLKDHRFLSQMNRPAWSKGYFFKRINDFCIKEHYSVRNISFPANSRANLNWLLKEVFWQWVEQFIKEKSYNALVLLQQAIHSDDNELSSKASEVYKQNFYDIALQDPQKASECLREIASYSCCYFTDGRGSEERHQNFNLYDVFDETIPILTKINKELSIVPFFTFLGPHRNVPQRMRKKYGAQINTALSMQIKNQNLGNKAQFTGKRVLIIGGYGNFGSYISKRLALEKSIQLIIAGRSLSKAERFSADLYSLNTPETIAFDIHDGLEEALAEIKPDIVIHTSGPFQEQGYDVAKACIAKGCHYIDLADGRAFVEGISALNAVAKEKGVLVVSGASSVPCLTSALVDHYKGDFDTLESLDYGITTAQKTNRGLATTAAILGYTGKPFQTLIDGKMQDVYGWQNLHTRKYKELGWRLLGNCDVPDLALFPKRYPDLKTVRFYAGLEIPFIHFTLWVLSWLVHIGVIKRLDKAAPLLLKTSYLFDWLGSANSAFHMEMSGKGKDGAAKTITFELTARSGDGPYIPCMPAILMAKKLAAGEVEQRGAFPCVGFISKGEYLRALSSLDISWEET